MSKDQADNNRTKKNNIL